MIELKSRHSLSRHYIVRKNGAHAGELRRSAWRRQGEIRLRERVLAVRARGAMRGHYVLAEGDYPILELSQPSSWRSRVVFHFQGDDYEVLNRPWYKATQLVRRQGADIGSIRFRGFVSTRVEIDLPDSLPLEVQVFLAWYALVRRDEAAAAG